MPKTQEKPAWLGILGRMGEQPPVDLGQAVLGQPVRGQAALKEWVEATAGAMATASPPPHSSCFGCSVGRGTVAGGPASPSQLARTTESGRKPLGLWLAWSFRIFPFLSLPCAEATSHNGWSAWQMETESHRACGT